MVERLGEMRKGRRARIEKGSREGTEKEKNDKETKGSWDDNLKICLLFSFLKALRYSSEDMMSSRLDSAVKRCSSEVLIR